MPQRDFFRTADAFTTNVRSVDRLLALPEEIVVVAVDALRAIEPALEQHHLHTPLKTLRHRLTLLTGMERHPAIGAQYEAMFNQCVVLLVSYFDSAVHTLFEQGIAAALASGARLPIVNEKLKISWRGVSQLILEGSSETRFAELLIAHHDISFQDMKSVVRAFHDHLKIDIERTSETNDIILGQAARHAIVHAGGIVDEQMVNQVSGAKPRGLKNTIKQGNVIRFSPDEVRALSMSMTAYVRRVVGLLDEASAGWASN